MSVKLAPDVGYKKINGHTFYTDSCYGSITYNYIQGFVI